MQKGSTLVPRWILPCCTALILFALLVLFGFIADITVMLLFCVIAFLASHIAARRFENTKHVLLLCLAVLVACIIRAICMNAQTPDYNNFLHPWMMEFKIGGGFAALQTTTSNYTLPYLYYLAAISYTNMYDLYAIKLLSIVFEMSIVVTLIDIVLHLTKHQGKALLVAILALFWPTFILNAAYWAQCDAIFSAFCLLSLLCTLRGKPIMAVVWATLALAFKLQAIFFLPVFLVFLIAKRVKLWHAVFFPLVLAITAIPSLFFGWTLKRVISIYTGQVNIYSDYLTLNAPSVFAMIPYAPKEPFFTIGLLAGTLFLVLLYAFTLWKRAHITDANLVLLTATIAIGLPWLLPAMHDRYFYWGEVLILVVVMRFPRQWYLAPITLYASLSGYFAYLVEGVLSDKLWPSAFALLCVIVIMIKLLLEGTKRHEYPNLRQIKML